MLLPSKNESVIRSVTPAPACCDVVHRYENKRSNIITTAVARPTRRSAVIWSSCLQRLCSWGGGLICQDSAVLASSARHVSWNYDAVKTKFRFCFKQQCQSLLLRRLFQNLIFVFLDYFLETWIDLHKVEWHCLCLQVWRKLLTLFN